MLSRLSEEFSGDAPLSQVEKDESYEAYFQKLTKEVESLDYNDSTITGRKIQELIKALRDVEQFDVIDSSTSIKEHLGKVRDLLESLVRTVNIQETHLIAIDTISDMTYVWEFVHDFVPYMHLKIRNEPECVVRLRTVFLKLTSVLDAPLIRISQVSGGMESAGRKKKGDLRSVAELYSSQLIQFVRKVMSVLPNIVFEHLRQIINIETIKMRDLPSKFEVQELKTFAQVRVFFSFYTSVVFVFFYATLLCRLTLGGKLPASRTKSVCLRRAYWQWKRLYSVSSK